jgi:hypothetical protein
MSHIQIKGQAGLIRDMNSKALLNTNIKAAQEYHMKTKTVGALKRQTEEINMMKQQLNDLSGIRQELLEMKTLLQLALKAKE